MSRENGSFSDSRRRRYHSSCYINVFTRSCSTNLEFLAWNSRVPSTIWYVPAIPLNYDILIFIDIQEKEAAFRQVYTSESLVLNRARLRCEAYHDQKMHTGNPDKKLMSVAHAMNDINIHRGPDPHLTMIDIYANGNFVTRGIADGVIISTPTGSTAYSLSSGGSIVHPSVPCTLVTPICPRSLSFRPLIFPLSTSISLNVSHQSRGQNAELSIDGIRKGTMGPGDSIVIEPERAGHNTGIWTVVKRPGGDWISNLNNLLGFNSMFGTKPD